MEISPVNKQDISLFSSSFALFVNFTKEIELPVLEDTPVTADPGFDSKENKKLILEQGFIPVIKPNLRRLKDEKRIRKKLDEFDKIKHIYKERYRIERCFAWKDKYRRLVIRYERLKSTAMGFRYLAYSMVNFRSLFGKDAGNFK